MTADEWFKTAHETCQKAFAHQKQELLNAEAASDEPYVDVMSLMNLKVEGLSNGHKARTIVNLLMLEAHEHDNEIGVILDEFQRGIVRDTY